jgi:post-segregation antitoxin (ccd killing protein)
VDEAGTPELSTEETEKLCSNAENAARKHVLSKVSPKMVDRLDVTVEAEGEEPMKVTVEVDLALNSQAKDIDVDALVKEATAEAHKAIDQYLRKLK